MLEADQPPSRTEHERRVREFLAQKRQEDPGGFKSHSEQYPTYADSTLASHARREGIGRRVPPAAEPYEDPRPFASHVHRSPRGTWKAVDSPEEYEPDYRDLVAEAANEDPEENEEPVATLHEGKWVYIYYDFNSHGEITGVRRVPVPAPRPAPARPRLLTVREELDERIRRHQLAQERYEWGQSEQGRVWKLHEDGLSYRQIAEKTGKAVGTVKATLTQARRTRARWGV